MDAPPRLIRVFHTVCVVSVEMVGGGGGGARHYCAMKGAESVLCCVGFGAWGAVAGAAGPIEGGSPALRVHRRPGPICPGRARFQANRLRIHTEALRAPSPPSLLVTVDPIQKVNLICVNGNIFRLYYIFLCFSV